MTEKERVEAFAKSFNDKDVRIRYVLGAFGDMENCVGIVEDEIFPEEGTFIKYLGCSYLQKGCPLGVIPSELIESYGMAKRILIRAATDIVRDKLLMFFILTFWLFKRKKFYKLINQYVEDIYSKTIGALYFNEKRYNKFPKEIKRAFKKAFIKETGINIDELPKERTKKLRFYVPLYRLFDIIVFLVDFDSAYKMPIQDALSEINKNNDPIKELERIVDLLIERSNSVFKEKPKQIKKAVSFIRFFPGIKRILRSFIEELNIEEIKMDEADWYFCLRRKLYNFRGLTLEQRLKELEKIDKEKGHAKINFKLVGTSEDFNRRMGII